MNSKTTYRAAVVVALVCGILPCLGYAVEISEESTSANEVREASSNESESSVSVSVGFDYSASQNGTNRASRSLNVPVILSYDTNNFGFSLTVPYLRQTGPAGTFAGQRIRPVGSATRTISESGLGDITGAVTGNLINDDGTGISVDLKGEIKFATADQSKGLGTGKNDYSVEVAVNQDYNTFGVSGTLGYSVLGSPGFVVVSGVKQNIIFNNVFYGSLGASYKMTGSTKAELLFNKQQVSEIEGFQQKDITANLDYKLSKVTSLQIYVLKGLAEGSPDWGSGASVSASF